MGKEGCTLVWLLELKGKPCPPPPPPTKKQVEKGRDAKMPSSPRAKLRQCVGKELECSHMRKHASRFRRKVLADCGDSVWADSPP